MQDRVQLRRLSSDTLVSALTITQAERKGESGETDSSTGDVGKGIKHRKHKEQLEALLWLRHRWVILLIY